MTDKEKLEEIVNLLTDSTVFKLKDTDQLKGKDEFFGALIAIRHVFRKAYQIRAS